MFNSEVLSKIKPGALLLNAGRGGVIDNKALLAHLRTDAPLQVALDVWESEPQLDLDLMALVELATPHIAGYSLEGKTNGTQMVFDAFLTFLGEKAEPGNEPTDEFQVLDNLDTLGEAILASYDVAEDDQRMRDTLANLTGPEAVGLAFDELRKRYPVRREFSYYSVSTEDSDVRRLGFRS
jgi:erythronate-4-phosphate dehydrogenase